MSTTATHTPVLKPGVIYADYDRFLCARTACAGYTALHTGVTIDGYTLRPITNAQRAEWPTAELGPIACECGTLVDGK